MSSELLAQLQAEYREAFPITYAANIPAERIMRVTTYAKVAQPGVVYHAIDGDRSGFILVSLDLLAQSDLRVVDKQLEFAGLALRVIGYDPLQPQGTLICMLEKSDPALEWKGT